MYFWLLNNLLIMAKITLGGNPVNTIGELPEIGSQAPDFKLRTTDLKNVTLADFKGNKIILNIFPSLDTGTCAASVRKFNQEATQYNNATVLCISKDLPFAHQRFCTAEGIENVTNLSDISGQFGLDYGVTFADGPIEGLLSRSIVVIGNDGKIMYTEQIAETSEEPNYQAALKAL